MLAGFAVFWRLVQNWMIYFQDGLLQMADGKKLPVCLLAGELNSSHMGLPIELLEGPQAHGNWLLHQQVIQE